MLVGFSSGTISLYYGSKYISVLNLSFTRRIIKKSNFKIVAKTYHKTVNVPQSSLLLVS